MEGAQPKADWQRWFTKFQGSELLPIVPPGAKIKPGSKLTPAILGKAPGKWTPEGFVGFGGKWSLDYQMTEEDAKRAAKWGAGIGVQGRIFPAGDCDVEDQYLAKEI